MWKRKKWKKKKWERISGRKNIKKRKRIKKIYIEKDKNKIKKGQYDKVKLNHKDNL